VLLAVSSYPTVFNVKLSRDASLAAADIICKIGTVARSAQSYPIVRIAAQPQSVLHVLHL
jgi:hypothetical protein